MYIDPHVHCRDGKQAHKETIKHALQVAENAGVDAIFDMPNTDPPITTRERVIERLQIAESANSNVFYGLYIGLTSDSEQVREAVKIWEEFFPNVVGLKLFAGHSVGDLAVVETEKQKQIYRVLSELDYKGVIVVHCEKESLMKPELWNPQNPKSHCKARQSISELASVQDQVTFALETGFKGNLHIAHVSSPDSVEYINMVKKNHPDLKLSCGATPHHLFFNEEDMDNENGILLKVNPPLRSKKEQEALLGCLKKGMIDWIETDHAPHTRDEKLNPPYMSGIPWLNQWPRFIDRLISEGLNEKQIQDLTFNNVKNKFNMDIKKTDNPGTYSREYDSEFVKKSKIDKIKIGDKEVMPFTIPSGIIMTDVRCAERILKMIPEIGIWTTKSIGPVPRQGNREPILSQYSPGCFINAVGLTNPGAEEFAKELQEADIPKDKFVLASIFGGNAEEFVSVAKKLEPYVDGFELNLSCPHAKGYGMQLGQDCSMVGDITKAVVESVNKIVFAKLTPNAKNIGEIAKAAVDNGAKGIVAINTVGPGYHTVDGHPVLTNKVGGMSGRGILPIGLKCIKEIREAVGEDVIIIGMGGISNAENLSAYSSSGADIFGIGSALAGMKDDDLKKYFSEIIYDFNNKKNNCSKYLKNVNMGFKKFKVDKVYNEGCDFKICSSDGKLNAGPGQFVFVWVPGIGEKPFSVMDDDPLTLGILGKGEFTKEFNKLKNGDDFYIRGPYGVGLDVPEGSDVVLVGGGCGLAGIYLLAKRFSKKANVTCFIGARDKFNLPYLDEFKKYGKIYFITEDGSIGKRGLVTDLMRENKIEKGSYFFNCGPKRMVDAVLEIEKEFSSPDKIYTSVDYITRCGVGVCGSCSDNDGKRTCVEGPFMKLE